MLKQLEILGCDPSISNWGIAKSIFNLDTRKLTIIALDVIQPVVIKDKQIRTNSIDLQRAKDLANGFLKYLKTADICAIEVPHGSQSARAMASYGICVGIIGTAFNTGKAIIQVSDIETRTVITGKRTATKEQAVAWAMAKHPEAPWPMQTVKGKTTVVMGKAEHMADAIAAIYAMMETQTFKAMLAYKE